MSKVNNKTSRKQVEEEEAPGKSKKSPPCSSSAALAPACTSSGKPPPYLRALLFNSTTTSRLCRAEHALSASIIKIVSELFPPRGADVYFHPARKLDRTGYRPNGSPIWQIQGAHV